MAVRVCCAAQRANMCRQQHECRCMRCAHHGPQQQGRGASTHAVDHFGFWYVPDACIAPSAQRASAGGALHATQRVMRLSPQTTTVCCRDSSSTEDGCWSAARLSATTCPATLRLCDKGRPA